MGLGKLEVAALGTGDAHKVAEGGDDDIVALGKVKVGGYFAFMGNADGTTGAGEVAHGGREQGA